MIRTRIVIRPTRSVLDIYRRRKYRIVARFPGGREIPLGHAKTRAEAYVVARQANAIQTSPTAATGNYSPVYGEGGLPAWKRALGREDPIFY